MPINYIKTRYISWTVVKVFDNDEINDDACFLHAQTEGLTHVASTFNRPIMPRDISNIHLQLNEDGKHDKHL